MAIDVGSDVLIVTDIQNDFCRGGALAVPGADEIVAPVNDFARRFDTVVLVQDWHPPGHLSFASAHPGARSFDTVKAFYGTQILWPDHCVQNSHGAEFHPTLAIPHACLILRKGCHAEIDSYSAFLENDRMTPTGLGGFLRERRSRRLYLVGLATDFCIAASALDALSQGFAVTVVTDLCRAIDRDGSAAKSLAQIAAAGSHLTQSPDV